MDTPGHLLIWLMLKKINCKKNPLHLMQEENELKIKGPGQGPNNGRLVLLEFEPMSLTVTMTTKPRWHAQIAYSDLLTYNRIDLH